MVQAHQALRTSDVPDVFSYASLVSVKLFLDVVLHESEIVKVEIMRVSITL